MHNISISPLHTYFSSTIFKRKLFFNIGRFSCLDIHSVRHRLDHNWAKYWYIKYITESSRGKRKDQTAYSYFSLYIFANFIFVLYEETYTLGCVFEDWKHDVDYFYAIVFVEADQKFITWTVTAKSKNGWKINVILIQPNATKNPTAFTEFQFQLSVKHFIFIGKIVSN